MYFFNVFTKRIFFVPYLILVVVSIMFQKCFCSASFDKVLDERGSLKYQTGKAGKIECAN